MDVANEDSLQVLCIMDESSGVAQALLLNTNRDEGLQGAIEAVIAVDPRCLTNHESVGTSLAFERIYAAASVIMAFLDALKSSDRAKASDMTQSISQLASLLHIPFLSRLFELRQVFHDMAATFEHPEDTVAVVCWVDHVIAKLGDVTLVLLRSVSARAESVEDALHTILKHRDESALHAASQLPHSLEDTLTLVGSEHASPAAIRLALRLLYAVYVIGPQLGSGSPWTDNSSSPASFLRPLQTYIHKASQVMTPDQRIADAIAISLFAAADSAIDKQAQSPFRPHTQATLLSLMQTTLPPIDCHQGVLSPVLRPEPHLTALCAWGNTVEWCWTVWDDERIVEYDVILCLTSTWLYHLGPLVRRSSWQTPLLDALARIPDAAGIAVAALLHRAKTQALQAQALAEDVLDVVLKSTQAAAWLLNACEDFGRGLCHQLCKTSCALFVLFGDTARELQVKDIIIELLSYVPAELLSDAVDELLKESGLTVKIRLENRLHSLSRLSTDLSWSQCRATTQLLQFVTLIAHAGVSITTCLHFKSMVSFLKQVIGWLTSPKAGHAFEDARLLQALLTALAVVEISPLESKPERWTRLWNEEDIWALAIDFEHPDALTNSAFASYLIATAERTNCGGVWRATALDFLRDFFFELTSLRYGDEDQAVSTYACTVTMSAMGALVDGCGDNVAGCIRSSPWTDSLCVELGRLGQERNGLRGPQIVGALATALADKISNPMAVKARDSVPTSQGSKSSSRMRTCDRLLCFVLEDGPSLAMLEFMHSRSPL